MAWTIQARAQINGTLLSSSGFTQGWPAPPLNGDLGVAIMTTNDSVTLSTMVTNFTFVTRIGTGSLKSGIFYKANLGSDDLGFHIRSTGAGTYWLDMVEFTNGGAIDKSGAGVATSSSPASATSGGADTVSGDLVVAGGIWTLSKAGTCTTTCTCNNSATENLLQSNDAGSTTTHLRHSWFVTTSNGVATSISETNSSMSIATSGGQAILTTFSVVNSVVASPHVYPAPSVIRAAVW